MTWDPQLYTRFEDQRSRPGLELIARIPLASPATIVDLGCGTGNLTLRLAERWPEASVLGVDSSAEMLDKARAASDGVANVRFEQGDIADFAASEGERFELIFTNAALHWLPDHETLFPNLLSRLTAHGLLAAQMPLSWDQAYAREMRALLEEHELGTQELRERMGRRPVQRSSWYWKLLFERVAHLDLWETEYQHQLEGDDPIVEWTRSTALRPVLDALDDPEAERFLELYREAVAPLYRRIGKTTLFPFRRLFLVCALAGE
ncbi:MAG: methyltransferase domain-containing protein [Acidobacteriota bacterium]